MNENLLLLLKNTFDIEEVVLKEEIEDYFKLVEKNKIKFNPPVYYTYIELQKLNKKHYEVDEFYICLIKGITEHFKKNKVKTEKDIVDYLDTIICEIIV